MFATSWWQDRRMNHGFGREVPPRHVDEPHRAAARYLVLIESGGVSVALLHLPSRELVAEIDGGTEEVALMTRGLTPRHGADGPEWDHALEGHSLAERRKALVYELDV
jgi:hypothetical protein